MEINRRDWRKQDAKATLSPFSLHCRKLCIKKKRIRFEVDVFSPRGRDWKPTQRTSSKLILFLSDWIHLLCRSLYCESILCSIFVSSLRTDTRRLALQTEIVQDGSAGDIPAYLQCPFTPAERKQHTDNTSGTNDRSSVCEVTFSQDFYKLKTPQCSLDLNYIAALMLAHRLYLKDGHTHSEHVFQSQTIFGLLLSSRLL